MHHTGVAISCGIHPGDRHAFSISVRGQKAIDQFLVSIRRLISHEVLHFLRGGRQAGEVKSDAADLGPAVGFRLRFKTGFLDPLVDEVVERFYPGIPLGGHQRPMVVVFRTLCDPGFESLNLLWGESLVGLGRRHQLLGVMRLEALHDFAPGDISRRKHAGIQRILTVIEAQIALRFTRSVTFKAGVRENGAHVTIEIDGSC